MATPRILSVGQCGADHGAISMFLRASFGAEVTAAATHAQALAALARGGFDLVLVNRIGDRDGTSGVDLIRALKQEGGAPDVPVMLVSDYPDAQAEAQQLGARPGFGKSSLRTAAARLAVAEALGVGGPSATADR